MELVEFVGINWNVPEIMRLPPPINLELSFQWLKNKRTKRDANENNLGIGATTASAIYDVKFQEHMINLQS